MSEEEKMIYRSIKIWTTVSMIFGFVMLYLLFRTATTLDYYEAIITGSYSCSGYKLRQQYFVGFCLFYAMLLNSIMFIIYPILYLRKANKIRLGIAK